MYRHTPFLCMSRPHTLLDWLLIAFLLLFLPALLVFTRHWGYDDPYITYRYAENLRVGLGFVYNPGQRILSTTTPLWTLLLAVLRNPWLDMPVLANALSALSAAAGALGLFTLARRWRTPLAGWGVLAVYPLFPLLLSTTGSETPLYLALGIWAVVAYAWERYTWSGLLITLTTLARPDGILLAGVLGADYLWGWWRSRSVHPAERESVPRRIPWGAAAALGIPLALWGAFSLWYFGNPLPVTLAAKQAQGRMAISKHFAAGLGRVLGWYNHYPYVLLAVLALAGVLFLWRARSRWTLFVAWPVLYFAAYTVLGVSSYFWYYTPLVPGFVALAALGGEALWRLAVSWRYRVVIPVLLALAVLPWMVRALTLMPQHTDKRLSAYRAAGVWLRENTPPDASVGMLEVGIIGYYARRTVIDFAGLLQPDVAARMRAETTYDDTALWALRRYHPDYVLLHDGAFPQVTAETQRFCQAVRHFRGAQYGYNADLTVYACHWRLTPDT
ncbi:MAG: hypothetical protein Fur0018_07160 [Anaerolineales bacterium]